MADGRMWRQAVDSLILSAVLVGGFVAAPVRNAETLAWCYLGAYAVFLGVQAASAWHCLRGRQHGTKPPKPE